MLELLLLGIILIPCLGLMGCARAQGGIDAAGDAKMERMALVAKLRRQGKAVSRIADELNITGTTVTSDLKELRTIWQKEFLQDTDGQKAQDLDRLESILVNIQGEAEGGLVQAIDQVLKIIKQKGDILGYEAAKKVEVSGAVPVKVVEGVDLDKI